MQDVNSNHQIGICHKQVEDSDVCTVTPPNDSFNLDTRSFNPSTPQNTSEAQDDCFDNLDELDSSVEINLKIPRLELKQTEDYLVCCTQDDNQTKESKEMLINGEDLRSGSFADANLLWTVENEVFDGDLQDIGSKKRNSTKESYENTSLSLFSQLTAEILPDEDGVNKHATGSQNATDISDTTEALFSKKFGGNCDINGNTTKLPVTVSSNHINTTNIMTSDGVDASDEPNSASVCNNIGVNGNCQNSFISGATNLNCYDFNTAADKVHMILKISSLFDSCQRMDT